MSLKRQSITAPDLRFEDPALNRLMQFVRDLARELQGLQQMLRAGTAGQSLVKTSNNDYDATWGTGGGGGTVTGAENVGAGVGLFKDLEGSVLAFKTLIQGSNVTLTVVENTITISAASGGGGGSGTVTSVGIDSDDLDVEGSPVTSAGSITLTIKPHVVTYAKMQQTSVDSVVLGRRQGEGGGDIEELAAADLLTILGLSTSTGYPPQLAYSGIV